MVIGYSLLRKLLALWGKK